MPLTLVLIPYRLLLPLLFAAAFPGWWIKTLKRGGFGTRLLERLAIYSGPPEFEPCGAIHLHAVSVGEAMLALKFIRSWRSRDAQQAFVLATGTATGHAVATAAAIPNLRVTYCPLDFRSMVRRYLKRFEPSQLILVEGEAWPNLLLLCKQQRIPVSLINARMSPRSARRYRRFAAWLRPVFSMLDAVALQQAEDSDAWRNLGVRDDALHHTGSLKFDPGAGSAPQPREEFSQILDRFHPNRPVILAASTHDGEEAWLARTIQQAAPHALMVMVPRHAERRHEVLRQLSKAGFHGVLRSTAESLTTIPERAMLVIDSTGELRDWTAHADVVIIGKSFLSTGGQNPCEAVLAGKPVVFGPHMENFEPLASQLVANNGAIRTNVRADLISAIRSALDPADSARMTGNATRILMAHHGATGRIIDLLSPSASRQN